MIEIFQGKIPGSRRYKWLAWVFLFLFVASLGVEFFHQFISYSCHEQESHWHFSIPSKGKSTDSFLLSGCFGKKTSEHPSGCQICQVVDSTFKIGCKIQEKITPIKTEVFFPPSVSLSFLGEPEHLLPFPIGPPIIS